MEFFVEEGELSDEQDIMEQGQPTSEEQSDEQDIMEQGQPTSEEQTYDRQGDNEGHPFVYGLDSST